MNCFPSNMTNDFNVFGVSGGVVEGFQPAVSVSSVAFVPGKCRVFRAFTDVERGRGGGLRPGGGFVLMMSKIAWRG
jgi:hypothetical protein